MSIQEAIQKQFGENCFDEHGFHYSKVGLRFELGHGDHYLNLVLNAWRRSMEICEYAFSDSKTLTVCLRLYGEDLQKKKLTIFRSMQSVGIQIIRPYEIWATEKKWEDDDDTYVITTIAFEAPISMLGNLLWSAVVHDFFPIRPRLFDAHVVLFNLPRQVMTFPYDDRGMKVAGENHELLKKMYHHFNEFLLDYNREEMDRVFDHP